MKQEHKNTMWIMVARQKPPPPPIRQQTVNNPPPPRRSQAESKAMNMKIKQVRFSTHQVRNSLIHQSWDFTGVYFSFQENLNFFINFVLIFQIFQNWFSFMWNLKNHYFLLSLILRKCLCTLETIREKSQLWEKYTSASLTSPGFIMIVFNSRFRGGTNDPD